MSTFHHMFANSKIVNVRTTSYESRIKKEPAKIRFTEQAGRLYMLLSDIWPHVGVDKDLPHTINALVHADLLGLSFDHCHIVIDAVPAQDAFISAECLQYLVAERVEAPDYCLFRSLRMDGPFEQAGHAIYGPSLISDLLYTGGPILEQRKELHELAVTVLDHWSWPGCEDKANGYPRLTPREFAIVESLRMSAKDIRKIEKIEGEVCDFLCEVADLVEEGTFYSSGEYAALHGIHPTSVPAL